MKNSNFDLPVVERLVPSITESEEIIKRDAPRAIETIFARGADDLIEALGLNAYLEAAR